MAVAPIDLEAGALRLLDAHLERRNRVRGQTVERFIPPRLRLR